SVLWTALAAIGLVFGTVYALWMIQRTFQGPNTHNWSFPDLSARELVLMLVLIALILWLGLYPQPMLNTFNQAVPHMGIGYSIPSMPSSLLIGDLSSVSPERKSLLPRDRIVFECAISFENSPLRRGDLSSSGLERLKRSAAG